jgi:transcriptional regulator with GAF, ATPase, and Fis domain
MGKPIDGVSAPMMERLVAYDWPGNVRELENIVERAMVLATGRVLELAPDSLLDIGARERAAARSGTAAPAVTAGKPGTAAAGNSETPSLAEVRRQHILRALERCDWVIEGPRGAAQLLGMQPSTLRSRLKKLGLQQRPPGAAP